MYVKCGDIYGMVVGPVFIGMSPGMETESAKRNIANGSPCQELEKHSWEAIDWSVNKSKIQK